VHQPSSPEPNQRTNINDSTNSGQIAQAGRNIIQIQFNWNWLKKNSAEKEHLNRQALLHKVSNYWIKGVKERSLYSDIKIELKLEERFDVLDLVWETPDQPQSLLPPGTKAISKFDELGKGARKLLILGAPGSGKTTVMLELADELLNRAEKDLNQLINRAEQNVHQPLPVVFKLSSWGNSKQKMATWLVQELNTKYQVPKVLGWNWIKKQQLLLLLDGLDEVRQERRKACIAAINEFNQVYGQTEMVVCCRIKDYQALKHRLRFQGALFLKPLTLEQIEGYLNSAGENLIGVKTALATDTVLQELSQTPLMLSIMLLAYQGKLSSDLVQTSIEDQYQNLFDNYIAQMLKRQRGEYNYSQETVIYWLGFLSQKMIQESQTLFLIENIQPTWLTHKTHTWIYRIGVGLISGLVIEWVYGLTFGLIAGLLSLQMLTGFLGGFILGLLGSLNPTIKLLEDLGVSWSWKRAWKPAILGFFSGPIVGLLTWLIADYFSLPVRNFLDTITISTTAGLGIAFIIALFAGLSSQVIQKRNFLNQGIWLTAKRALIATIIVAILVIFPLAIKVDDRFIPLAAFLGCVSLYAGGLACIQHFIMRTILFSIGNSPWNYKHFLNFATDKRLLNRVGTSYQFIHDFLRQSFSERKLLNAQSIKPFRPKTQGIFISIIIVILTISILVPLSIDSWRIDANAEKILRPRVEIGDCVLIDKFTHRFRHLERGDIISFKPDKKMKAKGFKYAEAISQIIGKPGENIKIIKGQIFINDHQISMQSSESINLIVHRDFLEYELMAIPPDSYFVLVNNPDYYDKKANFVGEIIPKQRISGRVMFRFYPPHKIGKILW